MEGSLALSELPPAQCDSAVVEGLPGFWPQLASVRIDVRSTRHRKQPCLVISWDMQNLNQPSALS